MKKIKGFILFVVIIFCSYISFSCAHSKPPKPGPNFRWVKPVKTQSGHIIPGHWIFVGAAKPGKAWIKGHHGPRGRWIPGHWK